MVPRPFWGGVFFGRFGTPVIKVKEKRESKGNSEF